MTKKNELDKLFDLLKYTKDKYYLHIADGSKVTWSLYRKYIDLDVFLSEDNKAIMTSETNTIEELEKYLKEHCEKEMLDVISIANIIILIIIWLIQIGDLLEFGSRSEFVNGILFGGLAVNLSYLIIATILDQRHYDLIFKELHEEQMKIYK